MSWKFASWKFVRWKFARCKLASWTFSSWKSVSLSFEGDSKTFACVPGKMAFAGHWCAECNF